MNRDKLFKNGHHDWRNEHKEEEGDARGKTEEVEAS